MNVGQRERQEVVEWVLAGCMQMKGRGVGWGEGWVEEVDDGEDGEDVGDDDGEAW